MAEASLSELVRTAAGHHQAGRLREAEGLYRQALSQDPNHPHALHGLGGIAFHVGQHDAAIELVNRAIAIAPEEANFHGALGVGYSALRNWPLAVAAFRRALELKPGMFQWSIHLGDSLRMSGEVDEAAAVYLRTIGILPEVPEAFFHVGTMLLQLGRMEDAIHCAEKAVALRPEYAEAHNTLGLALLQTGRPEEAIAAFRRVVQLRPNDAPALNNLASVLGVVGRHSEVIEILRQALAIQPDNATAQHNLGNALKDHGDMEAAVAAYEKAAHLDPEYSATESNRLYALHFDPSFDAAALHREHVKWNEQKAAPLKSLIKPHANDRDPERRLRIGYVSPDFRHHVVGWNLRPLFSAHDHEQFEVFCYANVAAPDELTAELQRGADQWRNIVGMGDDHLADKIREDQIDILVDLTLHLDNNRLLTFARKPAPIQVTWLGYGSTTGLEAMDYRFSDPYMDPSDEDLRFYTEKTIRLPNCFWCYQPAGPTPDPMPLPALMAGVMTLGCLNNFAKVSSATMQAWGRIMKDLPDARLLVHGPSASPDYEIYQRFAKAGIPIHRLSFVGKQLYGQYLETYDRIDLALDPFPYNGGITTCDALWMGVPVITLRGGTAVGRGGASLLNNIGLPELIAWSPDEYVRLAVELARNLPRLSDLRATMRPRMQSSPLMDAAKFARGVEDAYRTIWRRWCASE